MSDCCKIGAPCCKPAGEPANVSAQKTKNYAQNQQNLSIYELAKLQQQQNNGATYA